MLPNGFPGAIRILYTKDDTQQDDENNHNDNYSPSRQCRGNFSYDVAYFFRTQFDVTVRILLFHVSCLIPIDF